MSAIVLIGLPGAGKTTVGRQLARRLQLPFVDSDQVIEDRLGCTIRAFFEREGEPAFRDLEEAVIDELTRGPACVLSTGGGAVLRPANRRHLRERGRVFYLRAAPEDLFRRLRHDRTRPLLQVADPLRRLRELYAARDPLYRETAHHVVETGRPSVTLLVHRMLAQLELDPSGVAQGSSGDEAPSGPREK
ncbi:shikimate kinase [Tepidimonas charontis]|uniref:Shikimate kinase n=1 Tax=Tepidimonas charontis TaxID=2267262 RepID=A0A554XJJ3_9BURK|nr:shikimate kinase [Tepidimonas charontis]TSE35979.1 Shikimate kinase 1 [Tepidimonas charontis]